MSESITSKSPESESISMVESFETIDQEDARDQLLQFNLSLLFSMITLAAFVAAMMAPFLRDAQNISYWRVAFILGLQAAGMGTYLQAALRRRKKMLEECGKRLGTGYCGLLRWRHWPFLKSWMFTLLVTLFQLGIAVLVSSAPIHPGMFMYWFYLFQLGIHSGMVFSNLCWQHYPNSFTFYENGLVAPTRGYMLWSQVTVRPSTLYPDRMVIVIHPDERGMLGDTKVVQAPKALRAQAQQLSMNAKSA